MPTFSQAVQPGSSEFYRNQLERAEDQKANPWGTAENHPGAGGKIAHVLSRIGNIAGGAIIPNVMAGIPGTELHRGLQEEQSTENLGKAEERETAARNVASEENLRRAQAGNLESETRKREQEDHQELVQDAQGNVTGWKDKTGALHSINDADTPPEIKGIANDTENKRRPTFEKDAQGNIVALSTGPDGKTSSQVVYHGDPKTVTETKVIMVNGKPHEVVYDVTPNSPNMGKRLADLGETMVPAAAAGTLTPLINPETGAITGTFNNKSGATSQLAPGTAPPGATTSAAARLENTKANQFNTQFIKPSTDIEQNYQKFLGARKEYDAGAPTGAASMAALAQHLGSTFGSVHGAQMGEHMIQEHKDAIGFLDSIGRYTDKLISGQQLSKEQWDDFQKLITNTREIQWDTAAKEGARRGQKVDFLPSDVKIKMVDGQGNVRFVAGNKVQDYLEKGAKLE